MNIFFVTSVSGNKRFFWPNKRNISESYSREMNEILDRYCTFTQDTEKG